VCAVADIKLRSLMDEIVLTRKPIVKKKQWIELSHPNHPEVHTYVQLSMELTTKAAAAKKKCFVGKDGYKVTQHVDYRLPVPYRPAAFSLMNPGPYISYLIVSMVTRYVAPTQAVRPARKDRRCGSISDPMWICALRLL
jgi:hypothetical protein